MEALGLETAHVELVRHVLGGVLRGHEHEHALPAVVADQLEQQLRAGRGVDRDGALADVGHCGGGGLGVRGGLGLGAGQRDAHRFVQQRVGQRQHRPRERGGEQQRLAAGGQHREQTTQLVGEAQVEQPVGLVQHQRLHVAQRHRVLLDEIEQPARRGHHDVGAAAQPHHLRVDGHAAVRDRDLERHREVLRVLAQRFADLRGELARGREHERAHGTRLPGRGHARVGQALQHRPAERLGLAGAGARGPLHVAACERGRNGRGLDGRRADIAALPGGALEGLAEAEGLEAHARIRHGSLRRTSFRASRRSSRRARSGDHRCAAARPRCAPSRPAPPRGNAA